MRKSHWISLAIALSVAALFAFLEQRRGHYYLDPAVVQAVEEKRGDWSIDKKLAFLMQRWEHEFYDARFKFRGDQIPNPAVVIIAIDENSLAALHQWPWPRSIHARL